MAVDKPYLSVVVAARNDDHGGGLLRRMQTFVNAWIGQSKRHGLSSELIVVEWNPPEGRPPLVEALEWPADTGPCRVRFVQVPPEIHRRYTHAESLPLYQMIAKNAGIRRARGRFILATNIDIVFSEELVRYLAQERLEPGRMYRIDRHDVSSDVPVGAGVDEQLDYCKTHLIRLNAREGTFDLTPDGRSALSAEDIADRDSGICLGGGWYAVERESRESVFRWVNNDAEVTVELPGDPPPALTFLVEPGPGVRRQPFLLQVLDGHGTVLAQTWVTGRSKLELRFPLDGGNVRSFCLHAAGGGAPTPEDPRILNFRVFGCAWDGPRGWEAEHVLRSIPGSFVGRTLRSGARLRNLVRVIGESDPNYPITVAVPGTIQRLFHLYYNGGVRGLLGGCIGRFTRPARLVARVPAGQDIFEPGSGVFAGSGWYDLERYLGETFRWVRNDAELVVQAPEGDTQPLAMHVEPGPGVKWKPFDLVVRDESGCQVASVRVKKLQRVEITLPLQPGRRQVFTLHLDGGDLPDPKDPRILNFRLFWCGWAGAAAGRPAPASWETPAGEREAGEPLPAVHLHTNACGDFTLMAREHWFDLRGYPEFDMYSFHLDSVLCYAAHHAGAREEVLKEPMRIYHIEHGVGSGWSPEGQARLFQRLRANGIAWLEYQELVAWAAQMRKLNSPLIFNRENWGLAEFELPEAQLAQRLGMRMDAEA